MLNFVFEKLATHFILKRLSAPIIRAHVLVIGYRTEISMVGYGAAYLLEWANILNHEQADKARMLFMGTAGIAAADKLTKYSNLADMLIIKAKALEAEREEKNESDRGNP